MCESAWMRMRMRMTTTIWSTTHTYNAICTCMARCVAPQTIQHDKQCGTMHWPVASLIHLLLQQLFHCFSPVFLFPARVRCTFASLSKIQGHTGRHTRQMSLPSIIITVICAALTLELALNTSSCYICLCLLPPSACSAASPATSLSV